MSNVTDKTVPAFLLEIDPDADAWRYVPADEWDEGGWLRPGADGLPDITLTLSAEYGWTIQWEARGHGQTADVARAADVPRTVKAMELAHGAFLGNRPVVQ